MYVVKEQVITNLKWLE